MKKISTNTSRKITKSNKFMSWVICMFFFLAVGMQRAQAQNQPSSQRQTNRTETNHNIPEYLIAKTKHTVIKSVSPKIIFDISIPFFNQLIIVDTDNNTIQSKFFLLFSVLAVLSVSARANAIENKVKTVPQWVTPLQSLSQPVVKKNYQHIPNHFKEFVVCSSSTVNKIQSSVEKEQSSSTRKESGDRIVASANSIPYNKPTLKIPIINKTAVFNAT